MSLQIEYKVYVGLSDFKEDTYIKFDTYQEAKDCIENIRMFLKEGADTRPLVKELFDWGLDAQILSIRKNVYKIQIIESEINNEPENS